MGYIFDGQNRRIILTPGTTIVDIDDLHRAWVNWMRSSPQNAGYLPALRHEGRNPDGDGGLTGLYFYMRNGWAIVPQSADHTLTLKGNLTRDFEDTSGTPLIIPVPGYTILVQLSKSNLAQGVVVSGGSGPSFTVADIWNYDISNGAIGVGRMIRRIAKILGLTSASVTVRDEIRYTSDNDVVQNVTTSPDGLSKTMSGSP